MKQSVLTLCLVSALVIPVKAEITFDPDCVLYYDFETLDANGKIVNLANPGKMDGTIVAKKDLAPQLVEDSPAARLRQSRASGVYEASEKSLQNYITSADSRDNGYVECMPLDVEWFSKTNFTVECFFKTENMTQNYTPLFRRWGGWNVQVNIGVGGTPGYMGINISTNALYTQTERTISSFTAGTWNHVALVVNQTGETKTLKTYFNWRLMETFPLPSNLANTNRNGSGPQYEKWFFAGADGGKSFDGKIDSIRVTLRALEPEEFLTDRVYGVGSTITHVTFDDATANASSDYGTLNKSKYQGSITPTYSDDVPGPHIRDGVDGELLTKHNAKSISFPDTTDHSWVSYGSIDNNPSDTYYLHTSRHGQYRTSGTIEFWMKSNQMDADYDTVLLSYYTRRIVDGETKSYQSILIRFNNDHRLEFGFSAKNGTWRVVTAASVDVLNGKWHHVAFTFKPEPTDPAKMVAANPKCTLSVWAAGYSVGLLLVGYGHYFGRPRNKKSCQNRIFYYFTFEYTYSGSFLTALFHILKPCDIP